MPRDSHDAYDVDVPSSLSSLSRGQLSRRRLLGGVLSAAAAGVIAPSRVAARGTVRDGVARSTDIRRTNDAAPARQQREPVRARSRGEGRVPRRGRRGQPLSRPCRSGADRRARRAAQGRTGVDLPDAGLGRAAARGDDGLHVVVAIAGGGVADVRGAGPGRRRDRRAGARGAGHRRRASRPRGHGRQGRRGGDVLPLQPEQPDRRERPGDCRRRVRRHGQDGGAGRAGSWSTRPTSSTSTIRATPPRCRSRRPIRACSSPARSRRSSAWPACASATRSRIPTRSRRCASRARAAR